MAVLDRGHAPGGEASPIADALHLVDDRHLGIAAENEIGVQRMRGPLRDFFDRAARRHQRLANYLPAIDALPTRLRRTAAKQVYLQRLEIEDVQQFLNDGR